MVYYAPTKFENNTSTLVQGLEDMCSIKYIPKGIFFNWVKVSAKHLQIFSN